MLLIRNADLYAPERLGPGDILIAGERVLAVRPAGEIDSTAAASFSDLRVIDAGGCIVAPGIIDRHVHFNGAGGEGGPAHRTPPLQLSSVFPSATFLLAMSRACRARSSSTATRTTRPGPARWCRRSITRSSPVTTSPRR